MREGDEWKTTFKMNEGLYEWFVILFGLANVPSTFMNLMNEVLKDFIGKFMIVYLDDILVFRKNKGEHLRHLTLVIRRLQQANLLINLKKSSFMKTKLIYLGFFICSNELKMDPEKVREIREWTSSKNIFEVIRFHGLSIFYQKFVRNFSGICAQMTNIVKKRHKSFKWIEEAEERFNILKEKIIEQLTRIFMP
jgi:hypothetical protein